MIDEASFNKIGNAALDLCLFINKLRLKTEHNKQANELVHNLLNAVATARKIKSPRKSAGKNNK